MGDPGGEHDLPQDSATTCSPVFGHESFKFRVRLHLQAPHHGLIEKSCISLMIEPEGSGTLQKLATASSLFISLTIKNQKDDNLSITMDEQREFDSDAQRISGGSSSVSTYGLGDLGFHHFMTFDLLMDSSAGYLVENNVIIRSQVTANFANYADSLESMGAQAAGVASSNTLPSSSQSQEIVVRVACEDDLRRHVGPGLVDFGAVHEFAVSGAMNAAEFLEVLTELGFSTAAYIVYPCLVRQGPRGQEDAERRGSENRNRMTLLPPLSELQWTRNSIADLVRPLGSKTWHLVVLSKSFLGSGDDEDQGSLLVFLKFYDPSSQSLEYIGNLMVKSSAMLSSLGPLVNQLIGLAPCEALSGYEELGESEGILVRPLWRGATSDVSDESGESGGSVSFSLGSGRDLTVAEYGMRYGAILCFQKRLSASTRLQLLQETASAAGSGRNRSRSETTAFSARPLPLPTIPAFLSTFVDQCTIRFRPLSSLDLNDTTNSGVVTITVSSDSSCRHLLSLLKAALCDHRRATGEGSRNELGQVSAGVFNHLILHKVVDHHVLLQCPSVTCLWRRTQTTLDGRPRGSLVRSPQGESGRSEVASTGIAGSTSGKILTVNEILHRQARARRRLAMPPEEPFVLYYQLATSIHAPSRSTLNIRWLDPCIPRESNSADERRQKFLQVPVRQDSRACEVFSRLRQMAPVQGSGQVRLMALQGNRILHVFHDNSEELNSDHTYLTLCAEELSGAEEERNDVSAYQVVEFVVLSAQSAQHSQDPTSNVQYNHNTSLQLNSVSTASSTGSYSLEPFLLSIGPEETIMRIRQRVSARLQVAEQNVNLFVVLAGCDLRTLHLDDESLFWSLEILYGDFIAVSVDTNVPSHGMVSSGEWMAEGRTRNVPTLSDSVSVRSPGDLGFGVARFSASSALSTVEGQPHRGSDSDGAVLPNSEVRREVRHEGVMGARRAAAAAIGGEEDGIERNSIGHGDAAQTPLVESPRAVVVRLLQGGARSIHDNASHGARAPRSLEQSTATGQNMELKVVKDLENISPGGSSRDMENQRKEYAEALRLVVALEQLLQAEQHKHAESKMVQKLKRHVQDQNVDIQVLQARVSELESQLGCPPQADAMEMLEEVMTQNLAGRSLAWLQKCETTARKIADKMNVAAASMRRAVPDGFRCPITQDVMVDPVMVAESGHTYERTAISRWLQSHDTDPKTNLQLSSKLLIPNHGLRATIEEFVANEASSETQ